MDDKNTTVIESGYVFEEASGFEKICIPDDIYDAQFIGYKVREKTYDDGEKGKQIIWKFDVMGKSGRSVELAAFTSAKFGINPKTGEASNARAIMAALQGKKGNAEDISKNLDAMIGKVCRVRTEVYNGGSGVKQVFAANAAPIPTSDDEIPF